MVKDSVIFAIFGFLLVLCQAAEVPSTLPRCRSGDNECIPRAINSWLKLAKDGNKAVNLPPFDPLYVNQANIIQDPSSNIAIKLTLKDVYISGLKDAEIYKTLGFEENPSKSKFEVHARISKLAINSKYVVDGKILILPITGSGNATLLFDDADVKVKLKLEPFEKDGEIYTRIAKSKLLFNVKKFYVNLENLFNGNKALGDNMNSFINDNWEIIFQELRPAITNTLSKIVTQIIDSVFETVPYKKLFLDADGL